MKVAIIHDWLTGMRGGEHCLTAFLALYPEADIFTLLHIPGHTTAQIDSRVKKSSWIGSLPGAHKCYRALLPLYPLAIRSLDVSGYDLVISLSHAAAKNIRCSPTSTHICYCFSPMRYIWDQAKTYFGSATPFLWPAIEALRFWDRSHDTRTHFVAISNFVAARIRCYYKKKATVIYPPVDTHWLSPSQDRLIKSKEASFLYAGALVPYKRVDAIVEAFNQLGLPLTIAGSGPESKRLKSTAKHNISFIDGPTDLQLSKLYRDCRALIFPVKEDFGIVPIECLASGKPVIGLYAGALKETLPAIKPWEFQTHSLELAEQQACGVFISPNGELSEEIRKSVLFFITEESCFSPRAMCAHAQKFNVRRFFEEWNALPQIKNKELTVLAPDMALQHYQKRLFALGE